MLTIIVMISEKINLRTKGILSNASKLSKMLWIVLIEPRKRINTTTIPLRNFLKWQQEVISMKKWRN